ncbi:porin [Massilia niastensis]|uniref:porin n=1 Tax=Massilia niastensis TaxID=544911 RepID=UPI000370974C|nr:porin [Massilia niastensis]
MIYNKQLFHFTLTPLAFGVLVLTMSAPAFAETEIEALRREVAEQRLLIQKILATQEAQKAQEVQTGGPGRGSGLQAGVPAGPAIPALTIYGVADVDVTHTDSGFGSKTNIGSGGYTASRLGIKGEKKLVNDITAVYLMEAGLSVNTGTVGTGTPVLGINNTVASTGALTGAGTQIFSRQIYAGLKLPIGTSTVGRQYAGSYLASVSESTALGAGLFGSSGTFLPVVASMPTRLNNSLVYLSPKLKGITTQLTLTTGVGNNVSSVSGTSTSSTTDQAGRGGDLAVFYASGPLKAAATAWHVRNASFAPSLGETGLATRKGYQLGAHYDFGIARIHATYVNGRIAGGGYEQGTKALSKVAGWSASAAAPVGRGTILASYTKADDKSLIPNKDAELVGMAYIYKLLDATTLYISWGKMLNQSNATYSLPNGGDLVGAVATPGFNPTGIMIGLNQVF